MEYYGIVESAFATLKKCLEVCMLFLSAYNKC